MPYYKSGLRLCLVTPDRVIFVRVILAYSLSGEARAEFTEAIIVP